MNETEEAQFREELRKILRDVNRLMELEENELDKLTTGLKEINGKLDWLIERIKQRESSGILCVPEHQTDRARVLIHYCQDLDGQTPDRDDQRRTRLLSRNTPAPFPLTPVLRAAPRSRGNQRSFYLAGSRRDPPQTRLGAHLERGIRALREEVSPEQRLQPTI